MVANLQRAGFKKKSSRSFHTTPTKIGIIIYTQINFNMANICLNFIQAFGESDDLNELKNYLLSTNDAQVCEIGDVLEVNESYLIGFTIESRWSPPVDWLQEVSRRHSGVLIECEYEECSSDIWGKFGFRDGELLFAMELPYLEGKHKSMGWFEFIECEVMNRLEEEISLKEFLEDFQFCSEKEINELKDMYYENQN